MKAMIMAAGVGSRLMPMTVDIPKPMIPMANRPLMECIIDLLREHGFSEIIANLHYHADIISNYFKNGHEFGVGLEYSREEELMGTAGGVKKCAWFLDDTFVVVSGDALTDINLSNLVCEHKKRGALATIALKEMEEVEHFGVVNTDGDGRIVGFQEKPRPEQAISKMVNTGIYVFEPEIFSYIPSQTFYDFGKELFPRLVQIKAPFYGVETDRYWCDVGNLGSYRQAHADILAGKVNIAQQGQCLTTAAGARVLVDENVAIGHNINFRGNVVIGADCRLGNDITIGDAIIWCNTVIEDGVVIDNAIVGSGCWLSKGTQVNPGDAIPSQSVKRSE